MDAFQRLLNFPERLEVWRIPNGNVAVAFSGTSIKGVGVLICTFGVGISFYEACDDYLRKISGKTLVVESNPRREYIVL